MKYVAPRLIVHGSVQALTLESPQPNDGNDPCRFNKPRDEYKQTGAADYILGQANLTTCAASA